MSKYVLLHGSLKLSREKVALAGEVVELAPAFVADVDPAGISFVTEAKYAALVEQVAAKVKVEKLIAEKAADLRTAQEKLASLKLNAKHLAAVEAIEAAKPAAPKAEQKKDGAK